MYRRTWYARELAGFSAFSDATLGSWSSWYLWLLHSQTPSLSPVRTSRHRGLDKFKRRVSRVGHEECAEFFVRRAVSAANTKQKKQGLHEKISGDSGHPFIRSCFTMFQVRGTPVKHARNQIHLSYISSLPRPRQFLVRQVY